MYIYFIYKEKVALKQKFQIRELMIGVIYTAIYITVQK